MILSLPPCRWKSKGNPPKSKEKKISQLARSWPIQKEVGASCIGSASCIEAPRVLKALQMPEFPANSLEIPFNLLEFPWKSPHLSSVTWPKIPETNLFFVIKSPHPAQPPKKQDLLNPPEQKCLAGYTRIFLVGVPNVKSEINAWKTRWSAAGMNFRKKHPPPLMYPSQSGGGESLTLLMWSFWK